MAIKMVREPSETPNINNIDDIVPMRYAYGNQNGYVIGKGNEISNTVNGLNFTVNSGRLVLQGVECDIDAVGVTITIDNIATKRYYVIYLQVNLGLNTAQILSSYDTATYPTIDTGDDLTENTTGVARLPLYRFTATSGVISDVNKVVESIKYTEDVIIKNAKNCVIKPDGTFSNIIIDNNNRLFIDNIKTNRIINLFNNPNKNDTRTVSLNNINDGDILEITLSISKSVAVSAENKKVYLQIGDSEDYCYFLQAKTFTFIAGIFTINKQRITTEYMASKIVIGDNSISKTPLDQSTPQDLAYYPIICNIDKVLN